MWALSTSPDVRADCVPGRMCSPPDESYRGRVLRDLVGAALAVAFLVLVTENIEVGLDDRALDTLGYGLLVVAGASLALCRRRPEATVAVVTTVLGTYIARRYVGGPVFVTGWIALFALSWKTDRRRALIGAAALVAVLSAASISADRDAVLLHLVFVGWSAAATFLGDALRNRRSYLVQLENRARDLERTREEEARRQVAEERLRIARDLHDGVAHAMATINVQAGAAAHVVDRRPEAAKEALEAIQRASGDVLDELATLLSLLRDDGEAPRRDPTPTLQHLSTLVDDTRKAGVPVALEVHGNADAVPRSVAAAAYRIVQESLTNVIRHAASAPTRVTVHAGDDGALLVEVADDGTATATAPPSTGAGTGSGIRGMRERAETTGGTLEAAPRPGGGFTVRATWGARS